MKKFIFYLFLALTMAACGGGSNNSSTSSSNGRALYGFNAEGVPFVATLNSQNNIYEYSKINATTGETSATVQLKIDAVPGEPSVYTVYDHGEHFLALDASRKTLLATTRTSQAAKPEPTLFALQPLVDFPEVAGSYYLRNLGPFWYRLNVSADGSFNMDCKSFTVVEDLSGVTDTFDACEGITFSQVRLQVLSAPYWKLSFQAKLSGVEGYSLYSTTLLFANSASGRVAYTGASTISSCPSSSGEPCNVTTDNSAGIWQESQNFNTSVTYGGTWLFNRQGGDSSQLSLNTAGTGTTASGLTVYGYFSEGITNIDQTRNNFDLFAWLTTVTSVIDTVSTTNTVTTQIPYGRSSLRSLGGNTAVESSTFNEDALFKRIPPETKTTTVLPNGTSGPYAFPLSPSEASRVMYFEAFVEVLDVNGSSIVVSNKLEQWTEFYFSEGQIFLRSPLAPVDTQGRQVWLAIKAILQPIGFNTPLVAWGIRVR